MLDKLNDTEKETLAQMEKEIDDGAMLLVGSVIVGFFFPLVWVFSGIVFIALWQEIYKKVSYEKELKQKYRKPKDIWRIALIIVSCFFVLMCGIWIGILIAEFV